MTITCLAVYERLANPNSLSALIANAKEWVGSEARFTHPYKFELDHYEPFLEQLQLKEPQVCKGFRVQNNHFDVTGQDGQALSNLSGHSKKFALEVRKLVCTHYSCCWPK